VNTISVFFTDSRELAKNGAMSLLAARYREFLVKEKGYCRPGDHKVIGRMLLAYACKDTIAAGMYDRLCYTVTGKPFFKKGPFHFSISHAGDLILLAVSKRHPVGADVVEICRMKNAASTYLHAEEADRRGRKDAQWMRYKSFIWARKEAFGKLSGEGIAACSSRCNVLGRLLYENKTVRFFDRLFQGEYACSIAAVAGASKIVSLKIGAEELLRSVAAYKNHLSL